MPEITAVWNAAGLMGYPFGLCTQLMILTAQRRTQVGEMRWQDVDLDAGTWTLRAEDTKSDRMHLVPLSGPAMEILRNLPRLGEHVFTTDGSNPIAYYSKGKVRLDAFIEARGAALSSWRLHDLRRSAATHMVRLGVSMEVVGRVLSHARAGVTARVYALHEYEPEKRSALERWAAEVLRAVSGESTSNVAVLGVRK